MLDPDPKPGFKDPPGSAGVYGPLDDHPDGGARRPRVDHNAGLHLDIEKNIFFYVEKKKQAETVKLYV
jgi:hypothetical protein